MSGFQKPRAPQRICVLLYGPAKSGKTRAMMTFPGLAALDYEGEATSWFAREFPDALIASVDTFADGQAQIEQIAQGSVECKTLGVDSLTQPHYRIMAANTKDGKVNGSAWPMIKLTERAFIQRMRDTGKHVCATAWERADYAKKGELTDDGKVAKGSEFARVGSLPDFDEDSLHAFDLVINTYREQRGSQWSYKGLVTHSRSSAIPVGTIIENVTFTDLRNRIFGAPKPKLSAAESGLKGEELAKAISAGEVEPPPAATPPATAPSNAQVAGDDEDPVGPDQIAAIEAAVKQTGLSHQDLTDLCIRTIGKPDYKTTTIGKAHALFAAIAHYRAA